MNEMCNKACEIANADRVFRVDVREAGSYQENEYIEVGNGKEE